MRRWRIGWIALGVLVVDYLTLAGIAVADLVSPSRVSLSFAPSCALAVIGLVALAVLVIARR